MTLTVDICAPLWGPEGPQPGQHYPDVCGPLPGRGVPGGIPGTGGPPGTGTPPSDQTGARPAESALNAAMPLIGVVAAVAITWLMVKGK